MKNGKLFKQVFAAIMCVAMLLCSLPGNALNVYAAEATPPELWKQLGEVDTTTGGAWHTVGGYGTEQAIFITGDNRNDVSHGANAAWAGHWSGGGFSNLHLNTAADAITLRQDSDFAAEIFSFNGSWGSETPAQLNGTPAYETPAEVFAGAAYTPKYNAYSGWTSGPLNDTYAIPADHSRSIATFTIPESKADKYYAVSVYVHAAQFKIQNVVPELPFEIFLLDMNNQKISETYSYNLKDFGWEGGYITFLVKGSFRMVMDRHNGSDSMSWSYGMSAFFFDEYTTVEELPESVLEGAGMTLWNQVGEVDTTTGGAWYTVGGYGDEQAIFVTGGNRNDLAHNANQAEVGHWSGGGRDNLHLDTAADAITLRVDGDFAEEIFSFNGSWGSETPAQLNCTPAYETPAEVFANAAYTPKYNAFPAWNMGPLTAQYPLRAGLEVRNIATFTVPESKADKYYAVSVYINTATFKRSEMHPEFDFDLFLLDMNNQKISEVYSFNTRDFDWAGGYVTFLVKGSFRLVMDRQNGGANNDAYMGYGMAAFFFDEVNPVEIVTPEAGTTYETWAQVGEIDKATGGYWHTRGYGDEQAIFITCGDAQNNTTHNSIGDFGASTRWAGGNPNFVYAVMPEWGGGSGIDLVYNTDLTSEYWSYIGSDAGTPNALNYKAAYETPAEVFTSFVPKYNTYTTYSTADTTTNATTDATLVSRNIATFDVPDSKAGNTYYFSIYLNTANYTAQPNHDFELFLTDMNNTLLGEKHRFNTSQFGPEGGYVTFKVQGDFKVVLDKFDVIFGFTAFFFNKKPVEPAIAAPATGVLLNTDTTTGGAWHTVGGYGTEQAIFVTGGNRNDLAHNANQAEVGHWSGGGRDNLHLDTAADAITLRVDGDFAEEIFSFNGSWGSETPAQLNCTPAYETPADVFANAAYIPMYNAFPAWNMGPLTAQYPLRAGLEVRNIATFTVPESKADKYYAVSVYINTATFKRSEMHPEFEFDMFLLDMSNNKISETYTFNTRDFDWAGGYVTFLVKGSFRLVMDRQNGGANNDAYMGYGMAAFFFDEYIPQKDEATSLSVTLGDPIGVNYGMNFSVQALLDSGAKMVFTQAGKPNVEISMANASRNDLVWFTKGVSAKEMADTITGQMVYSDGSTGKEYQQSVQGYARKLLGYTTTYENVALKDLVVRMLNYGAACQTYWNYNTGNMANKDLTTAVKTNGLSSVGTANLAKYARAVQAGNDAISLSYASLLLKSETILRLGFANDQAAGKTFKLNGVTLTPTVRGANTYVDITNIAAAELDNTYTVEIYEGETLVSTVKYSPMAYVHAVLTQSDDANLINVVKSLYLYNVAANEYFK